MKKKEQEIRNALNWERHQGIFACDQPSSPFVVENSASAMLDDSRKESDLFEQDVNAKDKYEREHKTENVVSAVWSLKVFKIYRTTLISRELL